MQDEREAEIRARMEVFWSVWFVCNKCDMGVKV